MSNAISGVGTQFRKWDGNSWERIAEVTNISGPAMSRETIDVTSLDSTDGYREFIGSFRDAGTVALTMNFTRAGLDLMKADFEDDTPQSYEIVIPDAKKSGGSADPTGYTSIEFVGLVQEMPLTIPVDDKISMDVTIKITGRVVVNDGANISAPA
jgi:predicted secreted protein